MKFLKGILFPVVMMIITAVAGYMLSDMSFDSVKQMRQLERVPSSKVGALLQGEANVTATAKVHKKIIKSFYTNTPSLYYYYTEEKEETDSDGNTSWSVVDSKEKSADFLLVDESGEAVVRRISNSIEWSIPESFQVTRGDRRYTEYRLEPGDRAFVFAMADIIDDQIEINFTAPGQYTPIISKYSEAEERSDMGIWSIVQIWLGVSLSSLCVYFIAYLFKIHRLIAYLSILTLVLSLMLIDMGLTMMKSDLESGLSRYQQQLDAATERTRNLLKKDNISFHGWNDLPELSAPHYAHMALSSKNNIREIRLNLLVAREQLINHMRRSPEKFFVGIWDIAEPKIVPAPIAVKQQVEKRIQAYQPSQLSKIAPGIFSICGLIVAVVFVWFGIRQVKLKRYIENVPTSSCNGVAYGVCEVKGHLTMKDDDVLISPLSESKCGWFYYHIEERRGSGKNAKWVTVKKQIEFNKYYCQDQDGKILIDPDQAEIVTQHRIVKTSGSMRYTEKTLRLNDELYVLGYANLTDEITDKLEISYSSKREPFIISNLSEQALMIKKARTGIFNLNVSFSSVVLSALLLFGMSGGFSASDYLFSAVIAPAFMIFIVLILHYNDIVFLRQRVERNNSNIKVSLKKRYELVPNIETILKEYLTHEKNLLNSVSEYRSQFKQSIQKTNQLGKLIKQQEKLVRQFSALQEDYPELKSNELIEKMMDTLRQLEDELMFMRRGYNDAVEVYNTRIHSIPDIIFTGVLGFREKLHISS